MSGNDKIEKDKRNDIDGSIEAAKEEKKRMQKIRRKIR